MKRFIKQIMKLQPTLNHLMPPHCWIQSLSPLNSICQIYTVVLALDCLELAYVAL